MKKSLVGVSALALGAVLAFTGCGASGEVQESAEESSSSTLVTLIESASEATTTTEEAVVQEDCVVIDGATYYEGDILTFGSYGEGPISWIIIDIDGDNVMLLSEYIIENKMFNEELTDTSWEECTSRAWLNGEFVDSAFTDEEKSLILDTNVPNTPNPEFDTQSGNATVDKVFLLSADEFEELVPEEYRASLVTDYAWKQNVARSNPDGFGEWFLRTPGTSARMAVYVTTGGNAYTPGCYVTFPVRGLRPAMWITASSVG